MAINVDYSKLPAKYSVVRGASVTHIFVFPPGETRDNARQWTTGNYLCNERQNQRVSTQRQHELTCQKCSKFYQDLLTGQYDLKYPRTKYV